MTVRSRLFGLALAIVLGCRAAERPAGPAAAASASGPRVLLIGLDGADMRILDRLIGAGKLPTFARLKREGAWGLLRSSEPMLSPIVWTTIVTGRTPQDHGIFDFVEVSADGTPVPISSDQRRVPALWDVAREFGRSSGFIGWYASYPAESVRGFQVSDRLGFHQVSSRIALSGSTFPEELRADLVEDFGEPAADAAATRARFFGSAEPPSTEDAKTKLEELSKIHATSELYRRWTPYLQRRFGTDLTAVYFETIDACGHLFMEDAAPGRPGSSAAATPAFADTVDLCYEYQDEVLADLLRLEGENTVTIVVSDHGFKSGDARPRTSGRADTGVAVLWHRRDGVIFVHGRGVAAGAEIRRASVLDIAPTVVALLGIPVSRELPGRPLRDAFAAGVLPDPIPTVAAYAPRPVPPKRGPAPEDPEALRKLAALGYLGGASKTMARDPDGRTAASHSNEGTARLASGDADGALRSFGRALELDPRQAEAFRSAATILVERGDLERAESLLERAMRAQPGDVGVRLQRASLRLRAGDTAAAADELAAAGRLDDRLPLYHLLRAALLDATGKPEDALAELELAEKFADPDDPIAAIFTSRAQIAASIGRVDVAEAALRRAEALLPEAALEEVRGDVALARRDGAAAARHFRKAAEARPADAGPERKLAAALVAASDGPGAEAAFRRAIAKSASGSGKERNYAELSLFLTRSGQDNRAREMLRDATGALPQSALLWALYGAALAREARWDEAIAAEERSVGLQPTALGCKTLGLLLARQGNRARAVSLWKQSLALKPDQPDVRAMLAKAGA